MILVDTSVWIDFFRNVESWEAARLDTALATYDDLAICGPIIMEIRQGVASDKAAREIERLFSPLVYLPTPRKTYCRAADIYRSARRKGKTIRNAMDCLIAACCDRFGSLAPRQRFPHHRRHLESRPGCAPVTSGGSLHHREEFSTARSKCSLLIWAGQFWYWQKLRTWTADREDGQANQCGRSFLVRIFAAVGLVVGVSLVWLPPLSQIFRAAW